MLDARTKSVASSIGLFAFSTLLFLILLAPFLSGQSVLLTSDAVISTTGGTFSDIIRQIPPHWRASPLLGFPHAGSTAVKDLLRAVLPSILYNNLHHGIGMLLSSFALIVFLKRKQIGVPGILVGIVTLAWLGSNFTLIYAGHPNKPFVILFFMLSLLAAESPSWKGGILWGACCGLMFAQQPDMGLFFGLFAGLYLLFRLRRTERLNPAAALPVVLPAAIVALLFALGPLLSGYQQHVRDAAPMQTDDPQAKWEYVTQWSWPPEETIAFIAPGYTGWRSGEPAGPYWGRMGRSADWERTGQGFMNFKLENTYLGFIPVAFALFALFIARRSRYRADIYFWGGAALLALLLAFGKYFPLYQLFYQLPVVNAVRNPNKFLQVFQVAVAILTAVGVNELLSLDGRNVATKNQGAEIRNRKSKKKKLPAPNIRHPIAGLRPFFWFLIAVLGVLALWAVGLTVNRSGDVARFVAQGWPKQIAQVITQNKISALWHAVFMTAATAGVFSLFAIPRFRAALRFRTGIASVLVLLVAADAVKLSQHYVKEMPRTHISSNLLTDFLQEHLDMQRVALPTQREIYGIWLAYTLPYHRIPTFNFHDMPRLPTDYQRFLSTGNRNPLALWRASAVRYLVAPREMEEPLAAAQTRLVFAYNIHPAPDGGFHFSRDNDGPFAVFEIENTLPRYALFAGSRRETDEVALANPARFDQVMLPPDSALPELTGSGQTGSVDVIDDRPGHTKLRVQSDAPAILRVAERYDPDWQAHINGEPVEVHRVDFLCQGVLVPAGESEIEWVYAPARHFFYLQLTGYAVLFGTLTLVWAKRRKQDRDQD